MKIPLKNFLAMQGLKGPEKKYYDYSRFSGQIELHKGFNQAIDHFNNIPVEVPSENEIYDELQETHPHIINRKLSQAIHKLIVGKEI